MLRHFRKSEDSGYYPAWAVHRVIAAGIAWVFMVNILALGCSKPQPTPRDRIEKVEQPRRR